MPESLEDQLSDLALAVRVPVPDGLEAAVMARVATTRPRHRLRRWVAGLLVGLLGAGVVASPVGASIREWFGLPGVSVTTGVASSRPDQLRQVARVVVSGRAAVVMPAG